MSVLGAHASSEVRPHVLTEHNARGITLVECLLAMLILVLATLGLSYSTTAGHQHLRDSDLSLRATRLAEHLLEEAGSKPYAGSGPTRDQFHVDDYNGFAEAAGEVRDFHGTLYEAADQGFSRSATVALANHTIPELGGAPLVGKTITVTVADAKGRQWQLSRFMMDPATP